MIPTLKAVLAALLLAAGAAAAGSRLLLDGGRVPRRPILLRRIHAVAGLACAAILAAATILGFILAARLGPAAPPWAAWHAHLALTLDVLILAKIGFLKAFPALRRHVPGLGLVAAGAVLVLVLAAFGFGVLGGSGSGAAETASPSPQAAAKAPRDAQADVGREMFAGLCAGCHAAGRGAASTGLSLDGLLKRTTLPVSGRPASEESIRLQLRRPFRSMPAFGGLSETEIEALLAYLRGL